MFSRLDPADLDRRLGTYFTALAAAKQACPDGLLAVALDGKTLRGARRAGATAAHLVSVFAHRAGLVLGRLAVAEKSNELPCVRKLLRLFRQMRLMVTVDSMHTSKSTATLICATLKSHYLMIVKSDQPTLLARIQALPWNEVPVTHTEEPEIAHGRIETRTLKVLTAARGSASPTPGRSSRSPENASCPPPATAASRPCTPSAAPRSNSPTRRRSRHGCASIGASRTVCTTYGM